MLISGSDARPHHRLRGLLQHIVFKKSDDLRPETAFLQMRVDVDEQFVVVVGQRLARRLREIIARVRRGGDFANSRSGFCACKVRSSMAVSSVKPFRRYPPISWLTMAIPLLLSYR